MIFKSAVLTFLAMTMAVSVAAETNCDAEYVSFDGVEHLVSPNDGADGANIQCAIDEATELGTSLVTLTAGTFSVGETIFLSEFSGALQGKTMADTRLLFTLADQSHAIVVEAGKTSIRYMSIEVTESNTSGSIIALSPVQENCSRKVTRFEADRIRLSVGQEVTSHVSGLITDPTVCGESVKMQGTVLVNRVEIANTYNGIEATLGGGARVDVYFSEIDTLGFCFASVDANQTLNFVGNTCRSETGVAVLGAAPAKSAATISNNIFTSSLSNEAQGVQLFDGSVPISQVTQIAALANKVTFLISGNSFDTHNIIGTSVVPVQIKSEAAVFKNTFDGPSTNKSQAAVLADSHSVSAGAAIYGNTFRRSGSDESSRAFSDIFLQAGSQLVRQPNSVVADLTSDSFVSGLIKDETFSLDGEAWTGIDSDKFAHRSGRSLFSVNGIYQPGSQFSSEVTNNTGQAVLIRSLNFYADENLLGSASGFEFLEDGILIADESFGLTVTLNGAASGVITCKWIMEYAGDVFTKTYTLYDPDESFF